MEYVKEKRKKKTQFMKSCKIAKVTKQLFSGGDQANVGGWEE